MRSYARTVPWSGLLTAVERPGYTVLGYGRQARKTDMKRAGLWLLTLLLAGCGASSPSAPAGDSATAVTPDDVRLSIVSFEGIQEHIARARGKVVVMDAWSTSCPPCLTEFHHLVELHKKYGPEQLACISLSFDYEGIGQPEEQREPVLKFLRASGATFDNLMSNEESDVLYRKFKLAAVPAVFVYDRAGHLRKRFDNEQAHGKAEAFTYEQVEQLVVELLKE
jgi:thiol-disulfide isomerase/thioredoxin